MHTPHFQPESFFAQLGPNFSAHHSPNSTDGSGWAGDCRYAKVNSGENKYVHPSLSRNCNVHKSKDELGYKSDSIVS